LFNGSACTSFQPGESCTVDCVEPYSGRNATSTCPVDNTNSSAFPVWQSTCDLHCPNPDIPTGYQRSGEWACAEGFRGQAETQCLNASDCGLKMELSGCHPLVPCAPLSVSSLDVCRFNVSACSAVSPGRYCDVKCKAPYMGQPAQAVCPPDNIDPTFQPIWARPACSPTCPDPNPAPEGYVKTANCGWQCAIGYAGTARADCVVNSTCVASLSLSGCSKQRIAQLPHCFL